MAGDIVFDASGQLTTVRAVMWRVAACAFGADDSPLILDGQGRRPGARALADRAMAELCNPAGAW